MLMLLRSADASSSRVIAHGLGCTGVIWSATTENRNADCLVIQELVCRCLLLSDVGTGAAGLLRVWLAAAASSRDIFKGCNEETRSDSQKTF